MDSAPDIQSVAAAILGSLGKDALTLEETRSFIGDGSAVFVSRMMSARGIKETHHRHAALYDEFVARCECAVQQTVCYPGVADALTELHGAGHALGLCTNKPLGPTRAVINHVGLEPLFGTVVAGDMLANRKPEPEMLLRAIDDLGGGATLYVGDSEIDSETARRAGVPFALYSDGYHKLAADKMHHERVFDHFNELRPIVIAALRDSTQG